MQIVKQEGFDGDQNYEPEMHRESSPDCGKQPYSGPNQSQVLQEQLPLFGHVPLVFYFPPGAPQHFIDLISSILT